MGKQFKKKQRKAEYLRFMNKLDQPKTYGERAIMGCKANPDLMLINYLKRLQETRTGSDRNDSRRY